MANSLMDEHEKWLRRATGVVVCVILLGIILVLVPRLGPRSPVAIVVLCALAVLTMKLVERRVRQWFNYWAARQASRTTNRDRRE
jgi:hypothetical protein